MIINHNIAALNTLNRLNVASNAQSKSMQKLSSGLRINSAADDAAGLAISEKMRAQIRGLDQATRNAQDGISLLQTAEGALNETHDILQRMRELAVQASNDTNTDEDRASIQTEISQLKDEIDRIGNTTEFNKKKLIDGSIGAKTVAGTNNAAVMSNALGTESAAALTFTASVNAEKLKGYSGKSATISIDGANITFNTDSAVYQGFSDGKENIDTASLATQLQKDINAAIDAYNTANGTNIAKVTVSASSAKNGTLTITSGSTGATSTIGQQVGDGNLWEALGQTAKTNYNATGLEGKFTAAGAAQVQSINTTDVMHVTIDGTEIAVTLSNTGGINPSSGMDMAGTATALQKDINDAINNYNKTVPDDKHLDNVTVSVKDGALVVESGSTKTTSSLKFDNSNAAQLLGLANQDSATQGGGIDFQIGANQTQTMKITIEDMRSEALGVKDIDVSNKAGAQEAITKIDAAIEKVSTQRSNLGAYQNRLEHTINNLSTSSENLTAAESRIRDVDMAKEMMEQTKSSILAQAAQAMLAQANQQPQGVLQLLR